MRTQNPSHAVRKNNGSILYKNACIVGLFTSAVSWPCCCQSSGDKAPALSLLPSAGQGDLPPLLLLPGWQQKLVSEQHIHPPPQATLRTGAVRYIGDIQASY